MTTATDSHHPAEADEDYEAWLEQDRAASRRLWKWSAVMFVIALAVFMVLMALLAGSGAESDSVVSLFE